MVMMQDALPGIKRFLKHAGLDESAQRHVIGFIVAFIMHLGRMSAAQAAQAIRIEPRHWAQVMRFLAGCGWSGDFCRLRHLADLVLAYESRRTGRWFLILDQTYCTQQGQQTENTFSHGQKQKSGKDRRRRKKSTARRCVAQRRVAACRIGPKAKSRTFYVHQERRDVQSVGDVQLVFSTTIKPRRGKPVEVQKILMTNERTLSAAMIVEWYDLRWQIEVYQPECTSSARLYQLAA